MELVPVESSMISAVAYDDAARDLLVIFNTGQTYVYSDVPREVYDGLLRASSKGSYMKDFVLDMFAYRRGSLGDGKVPPAGSRRQRVAGLSRSARSASRPAADRAASALARPSRG